MLEAVGDTLAEAIAAYRKHYDLLPEDWEDDSADMDACGSFAGACGGCGSLIMGNEEYATDSECDTYCKACFPRGHVEVLLIKEGPDRSLWADDGAWCVDEVDNEWCGPLAPPADDIARWDASVERIHAELAGEAPLPRDTAEREPVAEMLMNAIEDRYNVEDWRNPEKGISRLEACLLALAPPADTDGEEEVWCLDCGVPHKFVRPGKTQPTCDCDATCPVHGPGKIVYHPVGEYDRVSGYFCADCLVASTGHTGEGT